MATGNAPADLSVIHENSPNACVTNLNKCPRIPPARAAGLLGRTQGEADRSGRGLAGRFGFCLGCRLLSVRLSARRVDVRPYRWFSCASLVVMQRRKVTFKLYPNAREAERLTSWIRLHCELYNAALEERIDAYRKAGKSISYYD